MTLRLDRLATPIGAMRIAVDAENALRAAGWFEDGELEEQLRRTYPDATLAADGNPGGLTAALQAYFAGDLTAIDAIPTAATGTAFQRLVWDELRRIPCGATVSYGALAKKIGKPDAVRAVGLANGSNPVAVVVPCHRVIGANGSLTGYGGGLDRKRWLLAHERGQISG